jgi:hypothetical protein
MTNKAISKTVSTAPALADPAAFGLLGLGIITLLVGVEQLGQIAGIALILPWALMLGGIAQLLAGVVEFKRNNTFGATAFSGYGVFWISVSIMWFLKILAENFSFVKSLSLDYGMTLGFACVGWLLFTLYMTYGAASISKLLALIFLLIDVVFVTLIAHFFYGVPASYPGVAHLLLSAASFYGSAAVVLNTTIGKTVLPVGKPFISKK